MQEIKKPIDAFDSYVQGLINMHMDVCLIQLVRDYGPLLPEFDENSRDTAIDRSLDFLLGYVSDFEKYLDYFQSSEYIQLQYEKFTQPETSDSFESA